MMRNYLPALPKQGVYVFDVLIELFSGAAYQAFTLFSPLAS